MNFNNLEQAVESVRYFHQFFNMARIWNKKTGEQIYESREVEFLESVSDNNFIFEDANFSIGKDMNTLELSLPIEIDGEPYIIELIQRNVRKDQDLIKSLQELTITDSLTGLYNRRFIDEQISRDLVSASENDEVVSFIYADIDRFKKINDNYSHSTGDVVLKEIASILQTQIRKRDGWTARYGGDEFLLCLRGVNQETATQIAHRIRNVITKSKFYEANDLIPVSCSFGVQTFSKADGANKLSQVIELLDKKLYKAKAAGRNRVVV